MRCFNHPKLEAIGICSICNKGVCSKCAVEEEGKIYCRDCLSRLKESSTKCYLHPKSEAVGRCSACKRLICADCAIEKDGKLYCRACSAELPKEFEPPKRIEELVIQPRKFEEVVQPRKEKFIPRARVELSVKPSEAVSSTIFGGIIGGFLMGLPFLNLLLIWSLIGGFVTIYLLKLRVDRFGNGYIKNSDALLFGGLSGVIGAFITTLFNVIFAVLLKDWFIQTGEFLTSSGMDAGLVDILIKLSITDLTLSIPFILLKLIAMIILFAVLGAVGGALSSEFSKR